jgi:hypothetical protein
MPDAADDNEGIVLFGTDGAKYVIPMSVVRSHEVDRNLEWPHPSTAAEAPDLTPIQAYHAPITRDSPTAFFFLNR